MEIFYALRQSRRGLIGTIIVTAIILAAVFAPLIAPCDPYKIDTKARLLPPSLGHLFGTDHLGRDVLSRILYGTRTALVVGLAGVAISATVGLFLGSMAAYYGGVVENLILLVFDVLRSFPAIILMLVLVAVIGPSLRNIILAMGVVLMPLHGRAIRARALSVKEEGFIEAAKGMGATSTRIIWSHIIPNVVAPLIVMVGMDIPLMISWEAGLSFLGIGVPPPTASWGVMLRIGFENILSTPLLIVWPMLALGLTMLGFSLLAEGLRDVLDPAMKIELLSLKS